VNLIHLRKSYPIRDRIIRPPPSKKPIVRADLLENPRFKKLLNYLLLVEANIHFLEWRLFSHRGDEFSVADYLPLEWVELVGEGYYDNQTILNDILGRFKEQRKQILDFVTGVLKNELQQIKFFESRLTRFEDCQLPLRPVSKFIIKQMKDWENYGYFLALPIILEIISDSWVGNHEIRFQRLSMEESWDKARKSFRDTIELALAGKIMKGKRHIIRELDLNAFHLKWDFRYWVEKYTQMPQEEGLKV